MALYQLIYRSQPFGFDESMLLGILASARRNNPKNDITGALICRADLYLQLLEGPEAAVTKLGATIAKDDRHLEMTFISAGPVDARIFPNWAMLDDPAQSWLGSQAEIAAGSLAKASPDQVLGIFKRVAAEHRASLQPAPTTV